MRLVRPATYSLAALPSMTRPAPAKKRRLSTTTGTSSIAAPTGLPVLRLSSRPISSARASRASASLSSRRLRSCGVECCQLSNAFAAALAARSTSSASEAGTCAMTWPLAGFSTARVLPLALSTQSPLMNCLCVWALSITSVTIVPPGGLRARRAGRTGALHRARSGSPHCAPATSAGSSPRTTGSPAHGRERRPAPRRDASPRSRDLRRGARAAGSAHRGPRRPRPARLQRTGRYVERGPLSKALASIASASWSACRIARTRRPTRIRGCHEPRRPRIRRACRMVARSSPSRGTAW